MIKVIPIVAICFGISGCAQLHIKDDDSTGTAIAKGVARVPVALLTLGLSEAWHAKERSMESWLGKSEHDLIMAWGPPNSVYEEDYGKLLIYTENRMYISPATATTNGYATGYSYGNYASVQARTTTTYTPSQVQQWQVFRQFGVSPSGTITSYSWRGM